MTDNRQKMQPWQVFNAARKYLGANKVALIFNRQPRSAHDWAQDPTCTEQRCKSPLELLHALFLHMDTAGLGYVVRAAIQYLETAVDPEVEMPDFIPLPANCLSEEVLKDYSAVAAMQTAIENQEEPELISQKAAAAKAEIDRTYALYLKQWKQGRL